MNLKSLLLSSDEKTVRILRRVLSDLEIVVDHSSAFDDGIRRITRQRFEAVILDCSSSVEANDVMRALKAAPVNKRALSIVLVEPQVGLKGGFDMGAHFVLHKPLTVERAKSSFRAVRALMKRERRLQLRVPVQIPVECTGEGQYKAKTLDLCEGGMAIQFTGRVARETSLRFTLHLPGSKQRLELAGELAWEGHGDQAGVRFMGISEEQRTALRHWLSGQLPEPEPDDPPLDCQLTDLSLGACYLKTVSPFPNGTRVTLSVKSTPPELRIAGVVRISHAEFGMGIEFLRSSALQHEQVRRLIGGLKSNGDSPNVHVEPEGLEASASDDVLAPTASACEDALMDLFRQQPPAPVDVFLHQMQQQRHLQESR